LLADGSLLGQSERKKQMEQSNPSKNDAKENRRKRLAQCADVLTKYFAKWSLLPGSNQVSKLQIAVYAEALIDLSLEALEFGCAEATRTAERFPWPGHIRKAAQMYRSDRSEFLGPPRLEYEPITQEERDAALEFSQALKKLIQGPPIREVAAKKLTVRPSMLSLEEQKEELKRRGYLH